MITIKLRAVDQVTTLATSQWPDSVVPDQDWLNQHRGWSFSQLFKLEPHLQPILGQYVFLDVEVSRPLPAVEAVDR